MKRVAEFKKISQEQFKKDWVGGNYKEVYDRIKLPRRATSGSAGYDFFSTISVELKSGESVKIPTGIRVKISDGWVLKIYPRSSMGFKYRLQLDNTVGIIDADYYNSDNEGHIFIKITNDSKSDKTLSIAEGDAFVQGIFIEYGITFDDDVSEVRNGGIGSTGR